MSPASRRGPATAARWGLISSFESRGGNRAAPGPPPSPEWRGRPQRRAHPGNRHRTRLGDTGRRDRGRDEGDRGIQLPPARLAGLEFIHALQDCCLSQKTKRGGFRLAECLGKPGAAGSGPPGQPHKGLGELRWPLGARIGVQSRGCVCYLCVHPPACASGVCVSLWPCLCSTGLCVRESSCSRVCVCPSHICVCKHVCGRAFVCAHAHPPCVSVSVSVHTPACHCVRTRERLRLQLCVLPPSPNYFVLLGVCRGLAPGPSPGSACPSRRCGVISSTANYSPDQKPFGARTGCLARQDRFPPRQDRARSPFPAHSARPLCPPLGGTPTWRPPARQPPPSSSAEVRAPGQGRNGQHRAWGRGRGAVPVLPWGPVPPRPREGGAVPAGVPVSPEGLQVRVPRPAPVTMGTARPAPR